MSVIKFFIPRIANDVSKDTIKRTFQKLLIGDISEIDMYRKKSKKGPYWFAFVEVNLYDTSCAEAIRRRLEEKGSTKIIYDEPEFWEIKSYVPVEERCVNKKNDDIRSMCQELMKPPPVIPFSVIPFYYWDLPSVKNCIIRPSAFDAEDGELVANEYTELEKEIYIGYAEYATCY